MTDYQLWLGDCLEKMRDISDGAVDMVFADLPYGVTANKWDCVIPFEPLWAELLRVGKKNCAFVFTATQAFAAALIMSRPKLFRYDLIWEKDRPTGFLTVKRMPMRNHENVLVFYRTLPTYNPQLFNAGRPSNRQSRKRTSGEGGATENYRQYKGNAQKNSIFRQPTSVIKVNTAKKGKHPTEKPVDLIEWLVRTYTNEGDLVLDPTMGSGTTGVACLNTNRRFIGIEKDAEYLATARLRLESTPALLI